MRLRVSERKRKKWKRVKQHISGERETGKEGRKQSRGSSMRAIRSPAEAVIDCSNFTQAVGVECLWVSA